MHTHPTRRSSVLGLYLKAKGLGWAAIGLVLWWAAMRAPETWEESSLRLFAYFLLVFATPGVLLWTLGAMVKFRQELGWYGAVLYLVGLLAFKVAGTRPGFKATMAVSAHALLPLFLAKLLTLPAVVLQAPLLPAELPRLLPSSLAALLPSSASPLAQAAYVNLMMNIIGRGLVAISQTDHDVHHELSAFPAGYTIQMRVIPNGPVFTVEVQADGTLKLLKDFSGRATLGVFFKHMAHAFLVFSFQEGTARAFANDRMFVDGEISHAIRLVRCLNRMETLILPRFVAERAIKQYPDIGSGEKVALAVRIYGRVVTNLIRGA